MAKHQITLPDSPVTYAELVEIEKTIERLSARPPTLRLNDLHAAPQAFQLRKDRLGNPLIDRDHVRALASALNDGGFPLDDLLVTPIGDKFYVVDGHHRHAAYLTVGWTKSIPVKYFNGSVSKAELEAGCGNHRDKLPVSKESKLEHAWTLVRRDQHSIAEIHQATGTADRTISNMRKARRDILERTEDPWDYTWKGVKAGTRTSETFDQDSWVDQKAGEMAERICKDDSFKIVRNPEVLAEAILKISDKLPKLLLEAWGMGLDDEYEDLDI